MAQKEKRQIKNFIINPHFQIKFFFYFSSVAILLLVTMFFLMNDAVSNIRLLVTNMEGANFETLAAMDTYLISLLRFSSVFFVIAIFCTLAMSLVMSHRIAGPMKAIVDVVEQLRSGNYKVTRTLRPNDELIPIMDSLQGLAEDLDKKANS